MQEITMNKQLLQKIQQILGTRGGNIEVEGSSLFRFVVSNTKSENDFVIDSMRKISTLVDSLRFTKFCHNDKLVVNVTLDY